MARLQTRRQGFSYLLFVGCVCDVRVNKLKLEVAVAVGSEVGGGHGDSCVVPRVPAPAPDRMPSRYLGETQATSSSARSDSLLLYQARVSVELLGFPCTYLRDLLMQQGSYHNLVQPCEC